jgi:hypothetical protein
VRRDPLVAYDFRPQSCTLDYSFGVPFHREHFEHEERYQLDIEGDLFEPKLKNPKRRWHPAL